MDQAIRQIQQLGWEWRPDGIAGQGPGVIFTVRINGRAVRTFVPLHRVWVTFDQELQKVGCPSSASVGAPFSVGGFFSFVKKAASSVVNTAKKAVRKVVPKAIRTAAAKVMSVAKKAGGRALSLAMKPAQLAAKALKNVPVLGTIAGAAGALANLPTNAAKQLIEGRRIDRIAVDQFKTALGNAKTLAPYVQTVMTFVPGVGTGLSAGIGGALALASGKRIDQAFIEAARSAVPGGPVAQAAFSVATDVMQGKPIDTIAVNALPLAPAQKSALLRGLSAAKDLAAGKRVDQVIIDQATKSLPPHLQKAVQVGTAIAQAKNLQNAAGAAASGAMQLASDYSRGVAAARQFASGVRTPATVAAMQRAVTSKSALSRIVQSAGKGHPQAGRIVNALQMMNPPRPPMLPRPQFARPALRSFGFA